jgi:hypothetical protein
MELLIDSQQCCGSICCCLSICRSGVMKSRDGKKPRVLTRCSLMLFREDTRKIRDAGKYMQC